GEAGLGTLLSSKLNQWTLLVGSLPIAYGISHGSFAPLPLDARQVEEFLLTSAQAVMAVAVLTNLRFMRWEAGALLGLFLLQLPFPQTSVRYGFSVLYIFLAIGMFVRDHNTVGTTFRLAIRREPRPSISSGGSTTGPKT
ncbi:MAG: sodium:proton exchanger, partial [Actinomycetota bacterium]